MPMLTIAARVLNAAFLPSFAASIARIGSKSASPRPKSRYVGRRDSIPFRVLVAPASRAEVKPPTTMPPKSRANSIEAGLMSEGCSSRRDNTKRVFVMSGIVKRFAMASRRNVLRMVDPSSFGSGAMRGLLAGDLEDGMVARLSWRFGTVCSTESDMALSAVSECLYADFNCGSSTTVVTVTSRVSLQRVDVNGHQVTLNTMIAT